MPDRSGPSDSEASAHLPKAILRHLDLPSHPPDLSPARGPPQAAFDFGPEPPLDLDQTPPFDPADPEPVPEIDFDQSGF